MTKKYSAPQQRKIRDTLNAALSMNSKQLWSYRAMVLIATPLDHLASSPHILNHINKLRVTKTIWKALGSKLGDKQVRDSHIQCLRSIFEDVAETIDKTHPNKWQATKSDAGLQITRFSTKGVIPVHKHFEIAHHSTGFQVTTQINDGNVQDPYNTNMLSQRGDKIVQNVKTVNDLLLYTSLWLLSHKTLDKQRVAKTIQEWEPS